MTSTEPKKECVRGIVGCTDDHTEKEHLINVIQPSKIVKLTHGFKIALQSPENAEAINDLLEETIASRDEALADLRARLSKYEQS